MVMVGGVDHFLLIIGCMAGFIQLRPGIKQWGQFFAGGLLALAYFALIIVTSLHTSRQLRAKWVEKIECAQPLNHHACQFPDGKTKLLESQVIACRMVQMTPKSPF
jgi:hypothetical protein